MGRYLDCMADVLKGFHRSTFSKPNTEFYSNLAPCDFWAFPTMKRELRGKKFRSDQRSAARFREVGVASLAKGGTWKKRPSPHLHKFSTRSNKVSPRTSQTTLIILNLENGWYKPISESVITVHVHNPELNFASYESACFLCNPI
jgi:hypothetical protein